MEKEVKNFTEQIGATQIEFQKFSSMFSYKKTMMIVKVSRGPRRFWGLSGKIVDSILEQAEHTFCCVFLINENEGWLFGKTDIQHMIRSNRWKKATDGQYKIFSAHLSDKLSFSTIDKFENLFATKNKENHNYN